MKLVAVSLLIVSALLAAGADPPALPAPTRENLSYGPEPRNVLDLWQAESAAPTPLLVLIHGGGWLHGDKQREAANGSRSLLQAMLAHGISVASINYRYATIAPLPAPVHDAARAVQYLRAHAADLNLDPSRFAATGGSAGGCTSLWLAVHEDLADPASDDPVARQSSRLSGVYVRSAQTTIEPPVIREKVTPKALDHPMICRAGGYQNLQALADDYAQAGPVYREFSPLAHLSADDPPMLLSYAGKLGSDGDGIHDPRFGLLFKKQADAVGATCYLALRLDGDLYPGAPEPVAFLLQVLEDTPLSEGK